MNFIYLASQSLRRAQLLEQVGIPYQKLLADPQEDTEALEASEPGETPEAYVQRVTLAKLGAAIDRLKTRQLPPAPILCADTTVALDSRIFGKPRHEQDALDTLSTLSGQTHRVLTAVALHWQGQNTNVLSISQVSFEPLTPADIAHYIASQEPFGKAGAYAIQSTAAAWISRIEGSYSAIMGLPLFETCALLKKAGLF